MKALNNMGGFIEYVKKKSGREKIAHRKLPSPLIEVG
jgi:hypothetical protein